MFFRFLIIISIFSPFNLFPSGYEKDPVLFVHGYFSTGTLTWAYIKKRLIKDGWSEDEIFTPTFKNIVGCADEHAEEIKIWVEEIIKKTGKEKIDIVTHSLGAVDARYYIKFFCGYKYVRDFVSIAGANHGTMLSCLDKFTCAGKQLCIKNGKENEFFSKLNSCDETPGTEIKWTSIYSKWDQMIIPYESSKLNGAKNILLKTEPVGHAGVLFIDETYKYVKEALQGGGLNDNKALETCYNLCEEISESDFLEIEENIYEDLIIEEIIDEKKEFFEKIDEEMGIMVEEENLKTERGCNCNMGGEKPSPTFFYFFMVCILIMYCFLKRTIIII